MMANFAFRPHLVDNNFPTTARGRFWNPHILEAPIFLHCSSCSYKVKVGGSNPHHTHSTYDSTLPQCIPEVFVTRFRTKRDELPSCQEPYQTLAPAQDPGFDDKVPTAMMEVWLQGFAL